MPVAQGRGPVHGVRPPGADHVPAGVAEAALPRVAARHAGPSADASLEEADEGRPEEVQAGNAPEVLGEAPRGPGSLSDAHLSAGHGKADPVAAQEGATERPRVPPPVPGARLRWPDAVVGRSVPQVLHPAPPGHPEDVPAPRRHRLRLGDVVLLQADEARVPSPGDVHTARVRGLGHVVPVRRPVVEAPQKTRQHRVGRLRHHRHDLFLFP